MASQRAAEGEAVRIADLRNTAQQHLSEIDDAEKIEQEKERTRKAECERETQRRDRAQASNQTSSTSPKEKGGRMRTAGEVLNRLRWAADIDISRYTVGYIDRFDGCIELPVSSWIRDSTEEDWIPQHRIRYFKRIVDGREEVVWHRDDRIDKVFGSTE